VRSGPHADPFYRVIELGAELRAQTRARLDQLDALSRRRAGWLGMRVRVGPGIEHERDGRYRRRWRTGHRNVVPSPLIESTGRNVVVEIEPNLCDPVVPIEKRQIGPRSRA